MDNLVPATSRHVSTGAPLPSAISSREVTLAALWIAHDAEPVELLRTHEGRDLSRERYRRAEEFKLALDASGNWPDFLYCSGIVAQLALSSHLLDVGFPDTWCARYIGLNVDRSLAYANASGLGYKCAKTARLVKVLSPYWKWNCRHLIDSPRPSDGAFEADDVRALLNALLVQVCHVTGHRQARKV